MTALPPQRQTADFANRLDTAPPCGTFFTHGPRPAPRARTRRTLGGRLAACRFFIFFNTPLWTWSSTGSSVAHRLPRQPRGANAHRRLPRRPRGPIKARIQRAVGRFYLVPACSARGRASACQEVYLQRFCCAGFFSTPLWQALLLPTGFYASLRSTGSLQAITPA